MAKREKNFGLGGDHHGRKYDVVELDGGGTFGVCRGIFVVGVVFGWVYCH